MSNIIRRDYYLQKLIDRKENGLVKVITGIRRCGKSFLLFNLFYDYLTDSGVKPEQIISIALDDDTFVDYRDPAELSKYIRSKLVNPDMYYILIDEVQYAIAKDELKAPETIRLYTQYFFHRHILRQARRHSRTQHHTELSLQTNRSEAGQAQCAEASAGQAQMQSHRSACS